MIVRGLVLFNALAFLLFANPAKASCTDPVGEEGHLVYNADYNTPQFCDGTQWWGMKNAGLPSCAEGDTLVMTGATWNCSSYSGGGCTAPASCTSVGDVCSDGSIFAGFMLYDNSSCEALFVTDNNQSTSAQWKTSNGTDDISTDDSVDGQVNAANRGGVITDFPAFDLCESSTYHGKSDWYLPARAELNLLWLNRAAIDANAAGNFATNPYWSSTEGSTFNAWELYFGYGGQDIYGKTLNNLSVRCVRRDSGGDTTPDAFSFTDQTDVAVSTLTESNIVQITGISGSVATSISGGGSPEYRICSDGTSDANCDGSEVQTWTSGAATIDNNQYLQLRLTSSASNSTMLSATMTVGPESDQWDVTTEAGADPCAGSPSPGDVCADGTVYAGLSPDGNVAMYTTAADESGLFAWNNGNTSGYTTTSQTSTTTGEANTTNLLTIDSDNVELGTQPHLAAQQCANSTANGHSDWYLPAKDELNVLFTNKTAIGGFNVIDSFPAAYYWSSSELNNGWSWNQRFSVGNQLFNAKDDGLSVRCVRRD